MSFPYNLLLLLFLCWHQHTSCFQTPYSTVGISYLFFRVYPFSCYAITGIFASEKRTIHALNQQQKYHHLNLSIMKRFILTLVTVTLLAFTASAAIDMGPRHPRHPRHNHSLRYHRLFPRTCPACAFYVRHHRPHVAPPRPHGPRHHYAPAPRPPRHHARPQRGHRRVHPRR